MVLTAEPDEDLVSYDAAATDSARATRPALAEVFFDRGPGYVRLSGGVSFADVDAVGSRQPGLRLHTMLARAARSMTASS
ncbi:MAG: hypothetical protein ABI903_13375 [Actinomycetota bacterium]